MATLDRLETDRLVLRRSRVSDALVYRTLWTERDERVPPHRRIDADGRPTLADIENALRAEPPARGAGLLSVVRREAGDVIGYCGLTPNENDVPDEPGLAYEFLRSAHGHGYATEAARAVVVWARNAGCRRLWAGVWDWNVASRRVLSKLGFRECGTAGLPSVHGQSLLTVLDLQPTAPRTTGRRRDDRQG